MIDTIKFKVPSDSLLLAKIKKHGFTLQKYEEGLGMTTEYKIYDPLPVGEYDYPIQIYTNCAPFGVDVLYIEFSMPKVLFGHNVAMCSPNDFPRLIGLVFQKLLDTYDYFPKPSTWEVQRLDICWVWQYDSFDEAQKIIDYTKFFRYSRKNVHLYGTTSMFSGRSFSLRFYLKEPEFKKDGYKFLRSFFPEYAAYVLEQSKGIVRFEAELRKAELKRIFKKNVVYSDLLDCSTYYGLLEYYLGRFKVMEIPPRKRLKMSYFVKIFNLIKKICGYEPFAKQTTQAVM